MKKVSNDVQGRVPYEYAVKMFAQRDPKEMAELSGTIYNEENSTFTLRLMGSDMKVKFPEGTVFHMNGEEVTTYTAKIILIRFLTNAKGVLPTGKDITFKEIPDGHGYYSNFLKRTIMRLAKIYGNNIEELEKQCIKIKAEKVKIGDIGYKFEFVNNVYMTFVVWKGDDEFPENANILFDYNIQYYFNAEDLAVVPDVAIEILRNNGVLINELSLYHTVVINECEINI